jgi:hypothetical protein
VDQAHPPDLFGQLIPPLPFFEFGGEPMESVLIDDLGLEYEEPSADGRGSVRRSKCMPLEQSSLAHEELRYGISDDGEDEDRPDGVHRHREVIHARTTLFGHR